MSNIKKTIAAQDPIKRKPDGKEKVKAIRLECLACCRGSAHEVRACPSSDCPLWRFRLGRAIKDAPSKRLTRRAAIREKCLDCSADSRREISNCRITNCFLHPYRPYQQNHKTEGDSALTDQDADSAVFYTPHSGTQNGFSEEVREPNEI